MMRAVTPLGILLIAVASITCTERTSQLPNGAAVDARGNTLVDLWSAGTPAFGVYVPSENTLGSSGGEGSARSTPVYTVEGGSRLGRNPLYDFLFLNLEVTYDAEAISVIVAGLRESGARHPVLLVRIPPIERDGGEVARQRVREALEIGAGGVVLPHIRNVDEARIAVTFFTDAGGDVWSPTNPAGKVIAMLMVEDPTALAQVAEIADVPGYSILACGIGSLTRALGGDRTAAEAGNQTVLEHAKRVGVADMITADSSSIERRVREGFLALLMQGPSADRVIEMGRLAAGRVQR